VVGHLTITLLQIYC